MRLALDQNFPVTLVAAMAPFFPPGLQLVHVQKIDAGLATLDDDKLILELAARSWDGLVSTDYHMLDDVETVAAMVATKLTMVFVHAAGHDPLRASGALFLELPDLERRLKANTSNIFVLKHERRRPREAWAYLQDIAAKQGNSAARLWKAHRPD